MNTKCRQILEKFREDQPVFQKMMDIIMDELGKAIENMHLVIVGLEGRVKTPDSLLGKLELKGDKYDELPDVTDLVGARVITVYDGDINKLVSVVEKLFDIDWDNSVDKKKTLATNQVGYLSVHYICRIPESLYRDEKYPEINSYRFEVQLRTALQHVWATVNHDTGYKSQVEIPPIYIRRLSRLAGLLEIADEEFTKVIADITEYRRRVDTLISYGDYDDLSLDGDSFRGYMALNPFKELNERIASINNAQIQDTSYMLYLQALAFMGFTSLGDVVRMKKEYSEEAFQLAQIQIGGTDIDILASTVGLRNLCLVWILKNIGGKKALIDFFNIIYGVRAQNETLAARILKLAGKINLI